jgi:hypothetical protein
MTIFKRKLIGKGAFTKAYQVGENEVEVHSFCPAKECYAMFSQGNQFAPVIERKETGIYKMPLYPKVRAPSHQFNPRALHIYKTLRKMFRTTANLDYQNFCKAVNVLPLTECERDALIEMAGDVCNAIDCKDVRFEISPRNVTHDESGNLVLLDCFFSVATLRTSFQMRGKPVWW